MSFLNLEFENKSLCHIKWRARKVKIQPTEHETKSFCVCVLATQIVTVKL